MKYVYFLLSLILCFSLAPIAHAQYNKPLGASISIELTPENPGPNQNVTAFASSFSTDLNRATISWKINGVVRASGKGVQSVSFVTGNPGSTTNLSVSIKTAEGETFNETYTLKASSVDLIWQAQTYTPPFYKGKALYSHESIVTFVAIPHLTSGGQEINPKNLIYTWTKDGTVLGDYSGYGRNTYSMLGSIISRGLEMQVQVSSGDTGETASQSITLNPIEPQVTIYEKNPLYGIQFQKTLQGGVPLSQKEVQIIAFPYFFSGLNALASNLSYIWSINGAELQVDQNQNVQNFRTEGGTSGVSYISLQVDNTQKSLQFAQNAFNIHFTDSSQASSL